jgi:uncharacterized membrane protein YccC
VGRAGRSLRRLLTDALRVDRTQSDPVVAGRNALGLVIPLAVTAVLGHPVLGVQAAIGGLQTAFIDRPGPYRLRLARMLITSCAAGLTAGLAAGLGHSVLGSAALLAICAFIAGLLLLGGPSATQVGIAATACALIMGHIPERPVAALQTGLLVMAGGAVQSVLAIAAWPLRRHGPERRVLAALYGDLAVLARDHVDVAAAPPASTALTETRAVLTGRGHDHGPSVEAYRVLLDEAQHARREILVLSAYADRLSREGLDGAAAVLRRALRRAAEVFEAIAEALRSGHPIEEGRVQLRSSTEVAELIASTFGDSITEQAAVSRVRGLSGQLRAMVETSRAGATEGRQTEDDVHPPQRVRLRDLVPVSVADLDLRSPVLRHALRLAILVPLTDLVTRESGFERGYWVSLTLLVVLRPDFASTFQRSLLRVAGTLIGLLLASLLVSYVVGTSLPALIVLVGLYFFGMRLAGPTNIAPSAICLSGLVVVLLEITGISAHSTVDNRSVATGIGGAVALVAVLLWPTWERGLVLDRLSELIAAYRGYLQVLVDPEATGQRRSVVRSRARLARSDATGSLDRARAEPVDSHGVVDLASAVLAHTHRLVHALTAIDATGQAADTYRLVGEFRALVDAALQAMESMLGAVRSGAPVGRIPPLRALYSDLVASSSAPASASIIEATDRLVESLDSLADVLTSRKSWSFTVGIRR